MKVKNFILLFFIAALVLLSLTIVVSASEAADDVTDAAAAAETAETSKPSILTPEDEEKAKQSGKKFQFQTEVNRMMKLIINSLYKTKGKKTRELEGGEGSGGKGVGR